MFKGTYRYRIDAKGRLAVPSAFRRALKEKRPERVIVTLLDPCLAVYPPPEWARLEERLRGLPAFSKPAQALVRHLTSRATDCELDRQGRMLLPPHLRQATGLAREAVVVGVLDRFEVWSPSAWEQFLKDSERLLEDASLGLPWPLPTPPSRGGPSTAEP